MEKTYTERLKEFIGPAEDGRTDYFNLTMEQCIDEIKRNLTDNFSYNFWTFELSNEEIANACEELENEGIVHVFDEVLDSIVCFKSNEDMMSFYKKIRLDCTEHELDVIRKMNLNTPVINFF